MFVKIIIIIYRREIYFLIVFIIHLTLISLNEVGMGIDYFEYTLHHENP